MVIGGLSRVIDFSIAFAPGMMSFTADSDLDNAVTFISPLPEHRNGV